MRSRLPDSRGVNVGAVNDRSFEYASAVSTSSSDFPASLPTSSVTPDAFHYSERVLGKSDWLTKSMEAISAGGSKSKIV